MSNMKRLIENGHYYEVKAIAPTVYQLSSLTAFNLNTKQLGNGSIVGTAMFETEEDAREFLRDRAELYFENAPELHEALSDIECGCLTLDAVTAHIEKIEIDEDE